jgi:hypothetical protein
MSKLTAQGYTQGEAVTGSSRSKTIIEYGSGASSAAQSIESLLGGSITVEADSALSSGHVRVLLGKNYSGPGSDSGSSSPQDYVAPQYAAPGARATPATNADGIPCIN